jgi:hypothetical protein
MAGPRCACVDIGSNTTRLLVAEIVDGRLREIAAQRAFTRLGSPRGDGAIPAAKIAEVAGAVAEQVRLAREAGSDRIRVVATVLAEALGLDDGVGAEVAHGVAERRVADRGGDAGPGCAAQLHRGRADAARGAVDEQALAHAQPRLREERVVGGREDLGQPARVRERDDVGHRHELALVDDGELGLTAAADDPHDAVALGEALRARPEADDLARQLEPRDVRRAAGRGGVAAPALHHVGAVEPGAADADENLAGSGLGIEVLLDENLAVADRGGTHGRAV